jgi:sugar transferase (PEP-CTERM/EpsH1 system associated)
MPDILFLAQRIPYPPDKGDKLRSFHFLRFLAERHPVHLGCFVDDPDDWRHASEVKRMVASCCLIPLDRRWASLRGLRGFATGEPLGLPYYRDARMTRWVDTVLAERRPGLAFVFSSQVAPYVVGGRRPPLTVMDFCDVDSQKWRQYAEKRRQPMRWLYHREAERLLAFERRVALTADASLFVSAAERDLFQTLAPETAARIHAIGNGIDADTISPHHSYPRPFDEAGPVAVFTGAMDYWPNIEAVSWFTAEVLPLLRRRAPAWRLMIVGSNPSAAVTALGATAGVTVTGRVADVRPFLAHASVVVAPLLTARGVQNKVLEGMAMARPVVATPEANLGLDAEAGAHLLVAEGPAAFAAAVQRAAGPDGAEIGMAGRRRVVERYAWPSRFADLDRLLETLGR